MAKLRATTASAFRLSVGSSPGASACNTARYNAPLFDKPEGTLHDWEIFEGLGARMAKLSDQKWQPSPRPDQIVDLGLRAGPYGDMRKHPQGLSLAKLKTSPSGVDLGPARVVHRAAEA